MDKFKSVVYNSFIHSYNLLYFFFEIIFKFILIIDYDTEFWSFLWVLYMILCVKCEWMYFGHDNGEISTVCSYAVR